MTTATATARPVRTTTDEPRRPLAGTGPLIRFNLRRDRIRIPVWIAAFVLTTVSTVASFPGLYPTAESRQQRDALVSGNPAAIAMTGPDFGGGNYTYGAMLANEMLGFTAIFVALMSVLMVVRHTRNEEETGRAELVRATVVGRHAQLVAALTVAVATNVVLGALIAVGLATSGVESITVAGSIAYGASLAGVGLVFAGVAAVAAQVTEHARGASGMAGAAIGLAYALRAAGDVGNGALSWLSPIGWGQRMRSYVDERWWPLALTIATTIALVAVAFVLSVRRDVGAGLTQPRPGPAEASATLGRPLGFALRLQRANLIAWTVGMLLFGAMYGSIVGEIEDFVDENTALQDMIAGVAGATVLDAFLSVVVSILATVSTIYGVLAAQRLRSEETAGRVEPVLATGLSRTRWVGSHLTLALGGSVLILVASGLGLGVTAAASTGQADLLWRLVGAALAYVPALWISVGLAVALFGLVPRALGLAWVVLVYALVVAMLGGVLQFPDWMTDLSPFTHVPQLPGATMTMNPLLALTAISAGLVWVGIAAFRRRDLTTT